MIYVAYQKQDFSPQIDYVFEIIFSIYGSEWQSVSYSELHRLAAEPSDIVISYGEEKPPFSGENHIHVYQSDFFGLNYLKPESIPASVPRYEGLPVIYQGQGELDSWVTKSAKSVETNIDIIASSFFMLSRYEEVVLAIKDECDRFPAKASLAYRQGFLDSPIVNEYAELLWSWIHYLRPDLKRRALWPRDKEFAVCLTHDVDALRKYSLLPPAKSIGGAIVRQKNPKLAFNIALDYLATLLRLKRDPFDTFDYMLGLEQKYGMKSSFYFMAGEGLTFDSCYSITKPGVVELIQRIENEGCEVGLHASYGSYVDSERMACEKRNLDRVIGNKSYGCRQHYLRWKTPDTWRVQQGLGLLYDSTLAFADHIGFRSGLCLPFKPFDIVENRRLDIWELPLTVMDGSLRNPNYQNLYTEEASKEIIRYMEIVKKFVGIFVLLWHNSSLENSGELGGWRGVYEEIIKYISEQNAFVASGREMIDYWSSLNR